MEENQTVDETVVTEADAKQKHRGNRGELGVATAGLTIKQRWHAWIAESNLNPDKKGWMSLKTWARTQLKSDDGTAKNWLAHKKGSLNKKQTEANAKAAREARQASHLAHRKKKGDNK